MPIDSAPINLDTISRDELRLLLERGAFNQMKLAIKSQKEWSKAVTEKVFDAYEYALNPDRPDVTRTWMDDMSIHISNARHEMRDTNFPLKERLRVLEEELTGRYDQA